MNDQENYVVLTVDHNLNSANRSHAYLLYNIDSEKIVAEFIHSGMTKSQKDLLFDTNVKLKNPFQILFIDGNTQMLPFLSTFEKTPDGFKLNTKMLLIASMQEDDHEMGEYMSIIDINSTL